VVSNLPLELKVVPSQHAKMLPKVCLNAFLWFSLLGNAAMATMIESLLQFVVLSVMAMQFIAESTFQLCRGIVSLLVTCNYSHACSMD